VNAWQIGRIEAGVVVAARVVTDDAAASNRNLESSMM
jgi:hypothetical protein